MFHEGPRRFQSHWECAGERVTDNTKEFRVALSAGQAVHRTALRMGSKRC